MEKGQINYRTENRKAKGKNKDYSIMGLLRASFPDYKCLTSGLKERRVNSVGKHR